MHYCLNYQSSNGMQALGSTPMTTECHGMSNYVFNTTRGVDLRPEGVNTAMAQIADNLAQAQHQLAWSTWGLYLYLATAIASIAWGNWQSLYEGEHEVFWMTFNTVVLLAAPPTPVALCVYALTKIQKTFDAFVTTWNEYGGNTTLVLTEVGARSLQGLYWATFFLSLALLVAIWVKYKCSPAQRLARKKHHQTLFDEKQEIGGRASTAAGDVEAQRSITAPVPSVLAPSQPLRSHAP